MERTQILALNRVVFESWVYPLTSYLISGGLLYFFEHTPTFFFFFKKKRKLYPWLFFHVSHSLTTDILLAKLIAFHHCFNIFMSNITLMESVPRGSKCSPSCVSKVIWRTNTLVIIPSSMLCILKMLSNVRFHFFLSIFHLFRIRET